MKPDPAFEQHHDIEPPAIDARTFRQAWRIRTRLNQLLADKRITAGEWQCATEYRDAWDSVTRLAASPLAFTTRAVSNATNHDWRQISRLEAATRIRQAEANIGPFAATLLHACVLEDRSWASIGRQIRRDPQTARDWTARALQGLAVAWDGIHDQGPARPP